MKEERTFKNENQESFVLTPEYIRDSLFPDEVKDSMIKNIPWKNLQDKNKHMTQPKEWETKIIDKVFLFPPQRS